MILLGEIWTLIFLYELTQNNGPMNLSEMGITHLSKWPINGVGSLRTIYFS